MNYNEHIRGNFSRVALLWMKLVAHFDTVFLKKKKKLKPNGKPRTHQDRNSVDDVEIIPKPGDGLCGFGGIGEIVIPRSIRSDEIKRSSLQVWLSVLQNNVSGGEW